MSSPTTEGRLEELLQRWDERRCQEEDVPAELRRHIDVVRGLEPVIDTESTRLLPTPEDRVPGGTTVSRRISELLSALAV